ncbi:Predicted ATP-binding protein involved in virulence [Chitinophaga sp. CF118]|uniref:AAA family ATPase n=1 Tax=Chitinophaga sp. CF118 TaxID=1884367 RepID=UPI0008DFC6C0|nr:AAA family ATPase [Chitinophaga sp. CF118]SFD90406.1 Predicted ATP-binding protein involved in virulence [Chitinophaga sp. CF118]
MNIDQITIRNFRNIGDDEKTYSLDPNFTVIIGINGMGKSTILQALRIACGSFFLAIPDVKKVHIRQSEVHQLNVNKSLVPQKPVKIEAVGTFADVENPIVWRRQITEKSNSTTSSESDVGLIKSMGKDKFETVMKEGDDSAFLPVIAFFSISRAAGGGVRNRQSRIGRQIFKEGYQDWSDMKFTNFKYEDWLASYDVLKSSGKEYEHTKDAFFETLIKANRYIEEVTSVNGKLWLKVKMKDEISDLLPLELHSDGIRFFTEMVAEIAYRCIVLNGYLDATAIIESRGVIMIDELDLHIHPEWQRHLVNDLKMAFPGIQFVATTHSPFIVQSLEANELINLDATDGLDEAPNKYSIEEISEYEMGVLNVERSEKFLEMKRAAADYFSLVKNKTDIAAIEQAKVKLDELRIRYNNDPAYVALLESEFPR